MALKIKHGDLFKHATSNCIIAHGCNAKGVMGSGFARQIKEKFPEAYEAYTCQHKAGGLFLGDIITYYSGEDNIMVANCITQADYGRNPTVTYVDYQSVFKSLIIIANYQKRIAPDMHIHLPLIGGGLANGNRDILLENFIQIFADSDATLWLH